ncbi:MAG: hypothetical protein ACQEQ4_06115 [Fibrobacterota bacterium]
MDHLKETLIQKAENRFTHITPCSTKRDIRDCFSVEDNRLLFWFNTSDNSTHILTADIS